MADESSGLDYTQERIKSEQAANRRAQAVANQRFKNEEKQQKKMFALQAAEAKKLEQERAKAQRDAYREANELILESGTGFKDKLSAAAAITSDNFKKAGENLKNTLKEGFKNQINQMITSVSGYMGMYTQYMGKIDARLQTQDKAYGNFEKIVGKFSSISASAYIKQTSLYENLAALVEEGISYNIEQRAFLATVSDKIATTFDAANGTLLRLIRIQQADTTMARMGIEASLTRYFNQVFQDTSYLSTTYDTVETALIDAISQFNRDRGVEFEYQVQKWLGSLGSVGVSDSTLTTLASGISALVTGNISALNGNESLMRLMAMSASRAGLPLGQVLTSGLDAANTNTLMRSMVEYLQEIASTNNQVVKSQYAELFGVSVSDFASILSLTSKDLDGISANMKSYADVVGEVNDQLGYYKKRTHISELSSTLFENLAIGAAMNIESNPVQYFMWKALELIKGSAGEIEIPIPIPYVGTYELGLIGTLQTAMVGMNTLGAIMGGIGNLFSGKGLMGLYETLGGSEYTSRGDANAFGAASGVSVKESQSAYIGSEDTSNLKDSAISDSKNESSEVQGDEDPAETSNEILDILRSWDLDGYGVKAILVTPTITPSNIDNIAKVTTQAEKAVTIDNASSIMSGIEEDDPVELILQLLNEVVSGTKSFRVNDMINSNLGATIP